MTQNTTDLSTDLKWYPADIVADADSREPWQSPNVRTWYMEGRMVERADAKGATGMVEDDQYRQFARQMISDGSLDGQQSTCVRGLLDKIARLEATLESAYQPSPDSEPRG